MLGDNLSVVSTNFFKNRNKDLQGRFPGIYRAVVVETNDPLQIHRVRFKCPELHDYDLSTEDCPWAVPSPDLGGKNAGSWRNPVIGDYVWIQFEKDHPYGPVWIGFASGTRRRRYPLESIYTKSPESVDSNGKPASSINEFLTEYLPKDSRPMSIGWRDRYGSSEIDSSVGFFPVEHDIDSSPTGTDALSKKNFEISSQKPEVNSPDRKYCAKTTKYGIYVVQADIGYWWKKEDEEGTTSDAGQVSLDPLKNDAGEDDSQAAQYGEFKGIGDPLDDKDERQFEIDRYQYFTKLLNEDEPDSSKRDQRRFEVRTRAGHKFEMRDVGWAQKDKAVVGKTTIKNSKSRVEYKTYGGRTLSKWDKSDERWVKLRSKGGHLIEMMDIGLHPEKDEYYKRILIEECGADVDDNGWTNRDARQIRFVSRYGMKFVLDDRGTHTRDADNNQSPRGNGWLFKTRRDWESDDEAEQTGGRGFGFEAIDKDALNTTRWYTPKSKIIEMNDRKDYIMICSDTSSEISRKWKKLAENEFAIKIAMTENPELDTYHLKLDKRNGYLRLKTAAGADNGRRPEPEPEKYKPQGKLIKELKEQEASGEKMKAAPWPDGSQGLAQGLECRDGGEGFRGDGADGPWTEVVDIDHRGLWFTRKYGFGIWRAKDDSDQWIMIYDEPKKGGSRSKVEDKKNPCIVIHNNANGPVQIYCKKDIQLMTEEGDINLDSGRDINLKARRNVVIEGSNGVYALSDELISFISGESKLGIRKDRKFDTNTIISGEEFTGFLAGASPGDGAQEPTIDQADDLEEKIPTGVDQIIQTRREPVDRAMTSNGPFNEVDETVVTSIG